MVKCMPEGHMSLIKEAYNPCHYIVPTNQARPGVKLSKGMEVNVVQEDGPGQGLDDLAELEEDISNL